MTSKNLNKCCICGKSTYHGGWWNGWTDREYCLECAHEHLFDGEPEIRDDGQMLLDLEYE